MALSKEWYEIARDGIVIGHVQATWLGDAHDKAEAMFPDIPAKHINCFVVSAECPLTATGEKVWSASRRYRDGKR